jgi:hypothetical protein
MTVTIEILNDTALGFLKNLEQLQVIRMIKPESKKLTKKKKFVATSIDTRGFKFNRDEANER